MIQEMELLESNLTQRLKETRYQEDLYMSKMMRSS